MICNRVLIALLLAASMSSCDVPSDPDVPASMAVLSGERIVIKVGEWVNIPSLLGKPIAKGTFDGPFVVRLPQVDVKCTEAGAGTIKVQFADDTSATYSVMCAGPISIPLGDGLNVDAYFGLDVSWVSQSDGIVDIFQQHGDHFIICENMGSGTLWVAFNHSGVDYYPLTCHNHEQGGGS